MKEDQHIEFKESWHDEYTRCVSSRSHPFRPHNKLIADETLRPALIPRYSKSSETSL